ncbi:hypothetical protein R1flu_010011 [Riccia fluitans]|uniref:Ribosomal protein S1 n=1 Tax=Riccia fluitans TaxID=41844 RepID=A0ABD1Z6C5_9MARC
MLPRTRQQYTRSFANRFDPQYVGKVVSLSALNVGELHAQELSDELSNFRQTDSIRVEMVELENKYGIFSLNNNLIHIKIAPGYAPWFGLLGRTEKDFASGLHVYRVGRRAKLTNCEIELCHVARTRRNSQSVVL